MEIAVADSENQNQTTFLRELGALRVCQSEIEECETQVGGVEVRPKGSIKPSPKARSELKVR
jgi:hypothetical protein